MSPLGQQREVWRTLNEIRLAGHLDTVAYAYVRWCLREDLEQLLVAAPDLVPCGRDDLPPRQYDNLLVAAVGLISWWEFTLSLASQYGHSLDDLDVELVLDGLRNIYERRSGSYDVSPGLTGLIKLLDSMAANDRLEASAHYRREDDMLYLRLPAAVAKAHEYVSWSKQPGVELIDVDSYREQARDNCTWQLT
jgi:hypothetical protein